MKAYLCAMLFLLVSVSAIAQTADTDPATKDDVILYLQTMHTNDTMHKIMEVMSASMQQSMRDELAKQKNPSADSSTRMSKMVGDLIKNMPLEAMEEAMIPTYQKHFTHGDIETMNAFYASPVGQKVLRELPDVMQEGMQAMRPIINKYIEDSKQRMMEDLKNGGTGPKSSEPVPQS